MISGPSGVGKGTLIARLLRSRPDLWWSVSVTTRSPRPGEKAGVDYHFVSDDEFDRMIAAGDLLEWAHIYGHRSGTPRLPAEAARRAGRSGLFELDVQGARALKQALPDVHLVFIAPPSLEALRERLSRRGSESDEALERRLAKAEWEMRAAPGFDHVVVNDDVDTAVDALAGIISGSGHHDSLPS